MSIIARQTTTRTLLPSAPPVHRVRPGRLVTLRAFVALTKPRIIELLLVTTVPTMILAHRFSGRQGLPSLGLVVITLLGGTLAAGGANTLNCYLDRDIDALMRRTAHRPLVSGAVTPRAALGFGIGLSVSSTALMAFMVNSLSAVLTAIAIGYYVIGYTWLLKRRTPTNIVWGGAAGCMPVLIGWSAVTGSLSWVAAALFAVIFFWTPPHYWPLALRFREDYAAAAVPMLPVVAQPAVVAARTVVYSWLMVASSLAVWPLGRMGLLYGLSALAVGGWFLLEAHRLQRRVHCGQDPQPMRLFHGSISYLSVLFLALALDPLLPLG